MKQAVLALLFVLATALSALAVTPSEVLDDPALEARARALSHQLRCLVCQNQSIDESDADLARELRVLVRERLVDGDSDQQTLDFIVARYGEFVLLRPVFAGHTLLLWIAAPAILLIGLIVVLVRRRKSRNEPEGQELTPEEQAALARLEDGA